MNISNKFLIAITMTLVSGCTTVSEAGSSLIPLENRTIDICQSLDGFCYQYNKCVKKFLGICIKKEIAVDKIEVEFKDKAQAKQLYDMNFILKVREKPL